SCDGYGNGAAQEFSSESFTARVREEFDSYFEMRNISEERRIALWDEIEDTVLEYVPDGDASHAFSRLSEFSDKEFPGIFDDCY
ncbi:hypothetical protein NO135_22760, partial [Clostridioides difficile]|nr:hypothetical protein [Clostridioides difficile]